MLIWARSSSLLSWIMHICRASIHKENIQMHFPNIVVHYPSLGPPPDITKGGTATISRRLNQSHLLHVHHPYNIWQSVILSTPPYDWHLSPCFVSHSLIDFMTELTSTTSKPIEYKQVIVLRCQSGWSSRRQQYRIRVETRRHKAQWLPFAIMFGRKPRGTLSLSRRPSQRKRTSVAGQAES